MIASSGTPFGFWYSSLRMGHCSIGVQKRLFGWAAFSSGRPPSGPVAPCQTRPFQSVRTSGFSLVMPSHHTSPSGVRPTLVKIELPPSMVSIAFGLVSMLVPGATPKKPVSGFVAYSRPSRPGRIHAMSSPSVSTVQPGTVGCSIARLVLPQADGNAAATWNARPSGEVSLRISMCSAIQPSSRAITDAMRSA